MSGDIDQEELKRDLTWHKTRILQRRLLAYQNASEDQQEQDYDETLPPYPDLTKFPMNDMGNAIKPLVMFPGEIRYSPELKKYGAWTGRVWKFNDLLVHRMNVMTMAEFLNQAADVGGDLLKFAIQSGNARAIRGLTEIMRSAPNVGVELFELDAKPYLFNCANVTINLEKLPHLEAFYRHRREDLLTQISRVVYDPEATCPRFLACLEESLGLEMIPYMQKVFASCLSADVRHKSFFMFHGKRDAGKTQILNAIRKVLGSSYAGLLLRETVTGGRGSNVLADIAQMRGRRFIQVPELDAKLLQRMLKHLVQGTGAEIQAVRKYENPVSVPETWKLFFDCNDLPDMEDPDDWAFVYRAHPIYFSHRVKNIDKDLPQILESEGSGILNLMLEGWPRLQSEGLEKPPAVVAALDRWRRRSDNISAFLQSRCVSDSNPQSSIPAHVLYEAYCSWCERSLKKPVSRPIFAKRMTRRRYRKHRKTEGVFYIGLRIM
jgi:putative DNA primase/helicase